MGEDQFSGQSEKEIIQERLDNTPGSGFNDKIVPDNRPKIVPDNRPKIVSDNRPKDEKDRWAERQRQERGGTRKGIFNFGNKTNRDQGGSTEDNGAEADSSTGSSVAEHIPTIEEQPSSPGSESGDAASSIEAGPASSNDELRGSIDRLSDLISSLEPRLIQDDDNVVGLLERSSRLETVSSPISLEAEIQERIRDNESAWDEQTRLLREKIAELIGKTRDKEAKNKDLTSKIEDLESSVEAKIDKIGELEQIASTQAAQIGHMKSIIKTLTEESEDIKENYALQLAIQKESDQKHSTELEKVHDYLERQEQLPQIKDNYNELQEVFNHPGFTLRWLRADYVCNYLLQNLEYDEDSAVLRDRVKLLETISSQLDAAQSEQKHQAQLAEQNLALMREFRPDEEVEFFETMLQPDNEVRSPASIISAMAKFYVDQVREARLDPRSTEELDSLRQRFSRFAHSRRALPTAILDCAVSLRQEADPSTFQSVEKVTRQIIEKLNQDFID